MVSFLLSELKISTDEIIIHFVTEGKISSLHKDFFNDPTSTDCITFPLDPPTTHKDSYHVIGELFICPKTALIYSKKHSIDKYQELYRYLIHCILHLIGYDDLEPQPRERMKRKERALLKKLQEKSLLI